MKKILVAGTAAVSSIAVGYVMYEKYVHVDDVSHDISSSIPAVTVKDNCKLKLVQIAFRHGARTPIQTPEYLPKVRYEDDLMKHGAHTFVPYVTKSSQGKNIDISGSLYRHGAATVDEFNHGQLTGKGAQQMHQLGDCLRNHYISKLKFLPKDYSDLVYVRSTAVQRTVESARCTLAGLYPSQQSPIPIEISDLASEIMTPNFRRCEYLKSLTRWSWLFPDLIDGLQKEREEIQAALGISLDTKVHLGSLRDYYVAHEHHGVLPEEYKHPDVMRRLEVAAIKILDHVVTGYHHTREKALQLGIGPLLNLFLTNMDSAIDRTSNIKMRLFSGHDTTLMPLLRAFGVEDCFWTPFAANIILELYEDTSNKAEVDHYVRVLYEFEELVIPGCDGALCQIDQFRKAISKYVIDEKQFKEDCAIRDDHLLSSVSKDGNQNAAT